MRRSKKFEDKRDAENLRGEKSEIWVCFLKITYAIYQYALQFTVAWWGLGRIAGLDMMQTEEEEQAELQLEENLGTTSNFIVWQSIIYSLQFTLLNCLHSWKNTYWFLATMS